MAAVAATAAAQAGKGPYAARLVRFAAPDGTRLAASYRPPRPGRLAWVLLHGVASSRGEWSALAERLAAAGCGSLALDFRGHGDSAPPPHAAFGSDEAWARLERDIHGAVSFLNRQGLPSRRIGLIGASLGANLALKAAVRDPKIAAVALLSAGVEYRGVRIDEDLARFDRPLFIAAAPDDRYAFESMQFLRGQAPPARAVFVTAAHGHGAPMLDDQLTARLLAWAGALGGAGAAAGPTSPRSR